MGLWSQPARVSITVSRSLRRLVASASARAIDGIARAANEPMFDNRSRKHRLAAVRHGVRSHNVRLAVRGVLPRLAERNLNLDRLADSQVEVRAKQHPRVADVFRGPIVPVTRADESKLQRQVQRE